MEALVEQQTTQTYNTFIPENNANKYWKTFEVAKQFKNDPLEQRRKTLISLAGKVLDQLNQQGFDNLTQNLQTDGNTVNYLIPLLKAAATQNPDQIEKAEAEVITNLYTAIVEHPLADSLGEYNYQLNWEQDSKTGELKLKSDYGYIDDILDQAINNQSRQVPIFEIERNKRNRMFYEKLKTARQDPKTRNQIFVEISPSPPDIDNPEVKARGYKGKDVFSIYRMGQDGKEFVTQYWIPMASLTDYQKLLQEINLIKDEEKLNNDLDIMEVSGAVNDQQLLKILEFAIKKDPKISDEQKESINNFLNYQIRPTVSDQLFSKLYDTTNNLLSGASSEDATEQLNSIYKQIELIQFKTRLGIKNVANVDTFAGFTKAVINKHDLSYQNLEKLSMSEQLAFIQESKYKASGCGFKSKGGLDIKSIINSKGSASSILSSGSIFNEELFLFVCSNCGHEEDIDVPAGIYVEGDRCPGCGEYIGCGPESKPMEKDEVLTEDEI